MVALFGGFWISPTGETVKGGLIGAVDAIQNGWVRGRTTAQAGGLYLFLEGKADAIERAKNILLEQWGFVPKEITVDVDELEGKSKTSLRLTPEEFYGSS